MKDTKVYVVTRPDGKILVRTTLRGKRWYDEHPGWTYTEGWMNWKAQHSISEIYNEGES